MTRLHDVLELCLSDLEQGSDLDVILSRHPDQADELRPILKTSALARNMSVSPPTDEVVKRNRAKLLQHAAVMREEKRTPAFWMSLPDTLLRSFVALMVVVVFLVSGANLVRASAAALPGDGLYPVKRGWEKVSLFFTFDAEERETLAFEYELERLDELHALFANGRQVDVEFSGYLTEKDEGAWQVSDVLVIISQLDPSTQMPDQDVPIGAAVRVKGHIIGDGVVLAAEIELLPPGYRVPNVGEENGQVADSETGEDSGVGSAGEADSVSLPIPEPKYLPDNETIQGILTSIGSNFIVVDNILMDIRHAQIEGVPYIGVLTKAEGHYDVDGIFVVVEIEFSQISSSDDASRPGNNGNGNINSNDNDSNDNDNKNDKDND
ncbi:MAG TPA: DUF5667 domain-containing protein [Anaerolineales bacterium]|nr:DUF5667 domain-containing protein [Anaerolineales bacterium]